MQSTAQNEHIKGCWEAILEMEGLPRELPEAPAEIVELNEGVAGFAEEACDGRGDDECFRPNEDIELIPEDRALIARLKNLGWAATPGEIGAGREQIERLADAGAAYLRAHGKRIVLAMAGATSGDVRRAATRAEYRDQGTGVRLALGPSQEDTSPEELAAEVIRRLGRNGGAMEERALEICMWGRPPRLRNAALALLAERGEVRKLRCGSSGARIVVLSGTRKAAVGRELRRVADLRAALEEERRETMKPHASEVEWVGGRTVDDWLDGFRRAVADKGLTTGQVRELIRTELPFRIGPQDALGEDAEVEEWRRSLARRREENAGTIRRGLRTGSMHERFGAPPKPQWTEDPGLRRRINAQLRTGRVAYNTARAIYLTSLPTLAHKMLHLLGRDGRAPRERFLALATAEAGGREDPWALLDGAIRNLGEAGKIRRLRSRTTGGIHLEATEEFDEAAFARSLRRIIRSGRHGISVPGGWGCAVDPGPETVRGTKGRAPKPAQRNSPRRLAIPS
ncbi:MAG: hypothetical protein ACR2JR_09805 [Rubrobacteraceae bacterium]